MDLNIEHFAISPWTWLKFVSTSITRKLANSNAIDLLGDIFLHCKWLNTRISLVFIWSIHPVETAVKSDKNILSMPYCFPTRTSNLLLNFYRVYQRINTISDMHTRLIRASKMNSKKVYSVSLECLSYRDSVLAWSSYFIVKPWYSSNAATHLTSIRVRVQDATK